MKKKYDDHGTQHIFNLIGQHTDLTCILNAVTQWLELCISNALVTIMLYSEQEQTLKLVSGKQHFSDQYCTAIDGLKIGPHQGTFGAAAFLRKLVISPNLMKDDHWEPYRALIKAEKLSSCWAAPIISATGILYGTFATYYKTSKIPTKRHIKLLEQASTLVALALELNDERQRRLVMNEKYSSFYTYHPDIIFELDIHGHILNTNIACCEITGFSEKQIRGQHYCAFIPAEYHELANSAFEEASQGKAQYYELPIYNALGEILWLELTNLPVKQNQKVTGVFGIARDISLSRKNQENLRLLKLGVEASPNAIFITDASEEMLMVYVNPAFLNLTGYTEQEVIGQSCNFLQGFDTDLEQILLLKQAVRERKEVQLTLKNYCKDGSWFWSRLTLGPVLDKEGNCSHFLGIQEDTTQQRIHEEYIKHQHSHDYLTGLPNQKAFEIFLEQSFESQRDSLKPLILFYIDLDDFKSMNDSLGHQVGNQILKSVGERLQNFLKEDDFLSRFAEDEFALLISGPQNQKSVIALAEKILDLLSQLFQVDNHQIHLSASIGIAVDNGSIPRSSDLLYQSVLAMKEAKKQGRNTWQWYKESNNKIAPEIDYAHLRLELREAIQQKQFNLFYQPLVHPSTGKVKGVEALVRWCHPERGYIFPDVFIPLAERTGQIVAIGQWVLEKACLDIAEWNKQHNTHLTVSVNISPLQFGRTGFLEGLNHVLEVSHLPPELLKIEITEGVIITGAERTVEILKSVRALGVQVAIDDFGTGYSSLSYLRRLPINQIKLDRSFIEELTINNQDAAIVQSIIHLAHQLNLEVVAEGVETLKQASLLYQQGCDLLQGYFYAKPAPLTDLKLMYTELGN
ncbi:bifunctional diguanylate cyclase/phosphodiesterase [Acinetobacter sp. TSRC1-2]|uniref:bifunctional diguanylate cyclase/phosphodiesterase n=1 Tax=unclassified Acinetobacter TaxID=196816 RepID=UPI003CEBD264